MLTYSAYSWANALKTVFCIYTQIIKFISNSQMQISIIKNASDVNGHMYPLVQFTVTVALSNRIQQPRAIMLR